MQEKKARKEWNKEERKRNRLYRSNLQILLATAASLFFQLGPYSKYFSAQPFVGSQTVP